MRALRAWFLRIGGLFRQQRPESDFAEELESNLALHTEENVRRGMTPAEARRDALVKLGGLEQAKELHRERRSLPWIENLLQDLRYGLRTLRQNPGFAAVAVLTLALGIAANTAIFSMANALILNPLPFEDLDQLVAVRERLPNQGLKAVGVAPADFADWRAQNSAFQEMAAYSVRNAVLTGSGGEPESVRGTFVSPGFFAALGTRPARGRGLLPEESEPGRDRVALIGHGLWQRRFGADSNLLGKDIIVNGRAVTVAGILPPGFDFPISTDVWMPLALPAAQWHQRDTRNLYVLARLKRGTTLEQAQAEMTAVAQRLQQQYPQTNSGVSAQVVPLRDLQGEFTRPMLTVLLGMAGFLLLLACANAANLLFARAVARQKELAIRAAMGASRRRVIQQLITESVLLAGLAAGAGWVLALWAVGLIRAGLPQDIARHMVGWQRIGMDGTVLAFTLGLALATTLLFGLAPAVQASRLDRESTLKEAGRSGVTGPGRRGAGRFLVACELALALVLLVGAGLMVKGFWRILDSFHGADPARLLTVQVSLPESRYAEPRKLAEFYGQVLERMAVLPTVQHASAATNTPLNNRPNPSLELIIEGRPPLLPGERQLADLVVVSPEYFATLGVPLLRGRDFTAGDGLDGAPAAVISDLAARRYWPTEDPVGRRVRISADPAAPWITVAGVAGDVRQGWFDKELRPQLYFPYTQSPRAAMTFVLRTTADPMNLAATARAQIHAVDRDLPIGKTMTLAQLFANEVSPFSFSAVLMLVFGGVALVLAAVGVFGVMSYSVAQRRHEMGLRLALGASRADVVRLVLAQGARTAGAGLSAGLVLALALGRIMASTLYGVVALEMAVLFGFLLLLAGVAVLASGIPAWRVSRVDPVQTLRCE